GAGGTRTARLLVLGGRRFTNWSNFAREAWLIKEKSNKRSCLKPPIDADERGCSLPFIGANRGESAVPYPRRYEASSLRVASEPQSFKGETPVPRWLRGMAVPAMIKNLTVMFTFFLLLAHIC